MSKNYAIIIQFVLPLTTVYRSGAQKSNVYKRDAFVTTWRFHNRAWQPQRHDSLPETSGTLWIHRGALTNQRCSLATGCGINCKCAGLTPIVTTTMPVVNVHCVRHNTCHVTYTVTSPMCTRAERLTRAVESLAVHVGIQPDLCMRSEDLIFTG